MDITPSPRLLQMLGEIEFDEWQCLAELVDNSFDSFLEIKRKGIAWPGGFKVTIDLPGADASPEDSMVRITDSGPGMSYEQLEKAVRAGFSSNDRFTKLGLFGMGFNVSTARLGSLTRVITSSSDDSFWHGVEIDFQTIKEDFVAPDWKKAKDFITEHGTVIEIGRIKPDRLQYLQRHSEKLKTMLGQVYSYLLQNFDFELYINGDLVKPVRHCVWRETREVDVKFENGFEKVPAIVKIDKLLSPVDSCQICGSSQEADLSDICSDCGSTELVHRERKIWGWLGVQRFLSPSNYGIDFLRNGRKILMADKRLFEWKDPSDPTQAPVIEYPSELAHQGGRIVGEIHVDHIPVTYSKDAFEYSDRDWRSMVHFLRGEGPIRPQKAKQANYPENKTPLAQLCRGYAKSDPGAKFLTPGDGNQAIHQKTRDWHRKFIEGDPEYQSDDKWWEAVQDHDRIAENKNNPKPSPGRDPIDVPVEGGDDLFGEFPDDQKADEEEPTPTPPPGVREESHEERITRLSKSPKLASLSGDVSIPSLDQNILLTTFEVRESGLLLDLLSKPTAVWLVPRQGKEYLAFLDLDNPAFESFGFESQQVLAYELARHLAIKTDRITEPISSLANEIISINFKDSILTSDAVKQKSTQILRNVRSLLSGSIGEDLQIVLKELTASDQQKMQDEMVLAGGAIIPLSQPASLEFLPYLTLLRVMESAPAVFFDSRVFTIEYETLNSDNARYLTRAKYSSMLTDLAIAASSDGDLPSGSILRTRISAAYLQGLLDAQ